MTGLPPSSFTVLGASGYIGSRLVAHLRAQGHTVWAPPRGDAEVFTRPLGHVMYCVGLTAAFRTRRFDTVDAHVGLLAEVLRRAQFDSLLYLSSTRVYMGAASTQEDAALSVRPGDPSYLYNLTKLTGESLCHACGRAGVRVARLSNVVGPGMDTASGNLVAGLLRIALAGRASVYNVASGVQITHRQWLEWLASTHAATFAITEPAPWQGFAPIDVTRLRNEFGWKPRRILVDGKAW